MGDLRTLELLLICAGHPQYEVQFNHHTSNINDADRQSPARTRLDVLQGFNMADIELCDSSFDHRKIWTY